jgi:antitoxin component YwqK of YwqJK toxin-antitoxin module
VYKYFDENGAIQESGQYENGQKGSLICYFYPSKIVEKITFENGRQHGKFSIFDENRLLMEEGQFVDGKRDGVNLLYMDGQIKAKATWENGVRSAIEYF